ncbi:MAG: VanZ family protein [Gemmatimonadales bacterium]|nr:VanZ family protein [Gemmatimonadales bacterium]
MSPPPVRRLGAPLAASGLVAILVLTLLPAPQQAAFTALTPLLCLVCGDHGGSDVLLNLLLFAPMAAGLRLSGWSWRRVVLTSATLSFSVELLQYFVVPGRDASLSDLLTNSTGSAAAAALAPHLGRLLAPGPALARRFFLGSIALWLAVLCSSAIVMMPWTPSGRPRNDCTRSPGKADRFSGTVRSVVLNGTALPCDAEVPRSLPLMAAVKRGDVELEVATLSGSATGGRAVIHTLRVPRAALLVLAQQGRSAVFSAPTRGLRLRLYSPILRLPKAFPPRPGVPVRLEAGIQDRQMWLSSSHAGERRTARLALSPSHGWSAILPWGMELGHRLRLFTALWIGGLLFPAAYWAGFVRQPVRAWGGIAASLVAGLGVLPFLTGYAPAHWSEWLGGGLGVALGAPLHRYAAYLQSRCGSPSTGAYSSS